MKRVFTTILFIVLIMPFLAQPAQASKPVVHAVLFYLPTCGHCHFVMTEVFPTLQEEYGKQLSILEVDISTETGDALYQIVLDKYQTPADRRGVPTLIVGDAYLVGSIEIPEQFPDLIAAGLAAGGLAWPQIPGLEALIVQQGLEVTPPADDDPIWLQKFKRDLTANIIAVIVLAALIFNLIASTAVMLSNEPAPATKSWHTGILLVFALLGIPPVFNLLQTGGIAFVLILIVAGIFAVQIAAPALILAGRGKNALLKDWLHWAVPLIVSAGSIVAIYLGFIEAMQGTPICGPVGDCGSVQASKYAILFGILPVGVFGLLGNLALLAAWLVKQFGPLTLKKWSTLAMWGMAVFGVLFSTYLTFLEPFVIGATCMWCITSAVTMTLVLWVTTPAAKEALEAEDEEDEEFEAQPLPVRARTKSFKTNSQ